MRKQVNFRGWLGAGIVAIAMIEGVGTAWGQQRIEFQRQKFDRSRFERPGASVGVAGAPVVTPAPAPAPVAPPPSVAPVPPAPGTPGAPAGSDRAFTFSADSSPMDFPPRTREQETGLTAEELALVDQPLFDLVPKKWYDRASEWEEVKALQKKTGACILIYFKDPTNSDQKGMCNWFEGEAGSYNRWRKAMAYFIKFRIQLPGNTETRALAEEFRFKSTPAWFVLRPDGKFPKRLPVFTYPAGNPKPVRQDELMESLTELCTPAYANLF